MSGPRIIKAILFGLVFGFLLQKGGVAKFHILVGALLLEDFTVVKIMLTAVLVGMLGQLWLKRRGWIETEAEPFRWRRALVGGLIFGVGFAFSGYCPGTGAAALGQLNGDALFMALGMIVGAWVFALFSDGISQWESGKKLYLYDVVKVPEAAFTLRFAGALLGVLLLLSLAS